MGRHDQVNLQDVSTRVVVARPVVSLEDAQTASLLDRMLVPAKPLQEVLDELDRQYREQGKPAVWFLPLDEPISPHLDQLLGPVEEGGL